MWVRDKNEARKVRDEWRVKVRTGKYQLEIDESKRLVEDVLRERLDRLTRRKSISDNKHVPNSGVSIIAESVSKILRWTALSTPE